VSAKDVRIGDTMSLQQARVEAGINWDASEAARVGEHNLSLVVCWARVRLYRSVAAGQSSVGATASQASGRTAAFGGVSIVEDHRQLVELVQISRLMDNVLKIANDMKIISASRPNTFVSLEDDE